MLFEPDGITKIIIGTRINNDFNWYITDKDLWFMDYEKLHNDYKKKFENLKFLTIWIITRIRMNGKDCPF